MKNEISFLLFSDFHYKEGMYLTPLSDMTEMLYRANENSVDFIIHGGDFCNDYKGSPELVNTYLNNDYNLPVYGIYGNHELESKGNTMEFVTPLLTNDIDGCVWGTADGKIGDGSIGYYYFDKGDFRIICTDTNYSYNEERCEWQHNTEASWGAPSGNVAINSLGPVQLCWIEKLLIDAAENGKKCIVVSHASFNTSWGDYSPDTNAVTELFKKADSIKKNTVIMAINGHYHTNRMEFKDGILFFDVNTTRNGCWKGDGTVHYDDSHTFEYIKYGEKGEILSKETAPLSALWQSKNTWFFEEPLSAIVRIDSNGKITVEGKKTKWIYDVVPCNQPSFVVPEISSIETEV